MRIRTASIGILALLLMGLLIAYRTPTPERDTARGTFGGVSLNIELATSTAAQERGLGGRATVPPDYGMLFVFSRDDRWGFWMKDTLVPLDMFWLNDQGKVIWMQQSVATDTYPAVFYPKSPARFVLETAAGFARAHGIATGTSLILKNSGLIPQ